MNNLIKRLHNSFDIQDIEDYQKLLYIIYNNMLLPSDKRESVNYQIFSLLDSIIPKIEELQNRQRNISFEELYNRLISQRVKQERLHKK